MIRSLLILFITLASQAMADETGGSVSFTSMPQVSLRPQSGDFHARFPASDFRLIRELRFEGRDLFELAIDAGMFRRKGTEHLPGAERGAVSVGGSTWHGSNGVGLVAYDPQMRLYAINYLQGQAVTGHHLDIIHADDGLIFFSYGAHPELPDLRPALEVYSMKRKCFARIEAVTARKGRFGRSDMDELALKLDQLVSARNGRPD